MLSTILFPIKRRAVALMALLFFGLIPGSAWTQETPAAKEFEQNLEPLADAELLGDWRAYQHAISQGKGSSAFFTERGPKRADYLLADAMKTGVALPRMRRRPLRCLPMRA